MIFTKIYKFLCVLIIFSLTCLGCSYDKNDTDNTTTEEYSLVCSGDNVSESAEKKEYSAFNNSWAIIIEFGAQILQVDSDDGAIPAYFTNANGNYFAYSIKIHKTFNSTTGMSKFHNAWVDSQIIPEKIHSHLNEVADYQNKDEIISQYDDIVLINDKSSTKISSGEIYLAFVRNNIVYYPNVFYGNQTNEAYAWTLTTDNVELAPVIIPINDKKICLPANFFDKDSNPIASMFSETNDKLSQLGLTDNLFRDGMTVDELEEYFDLVTDENTFAPLFE